MLNGEDQVAIRLKWNQNISVILAKDLLASLDEKSRDLNDLKFP